MTLIFFAPGIPVVYYGTEQSFGHEDQRHALWESGYSRQTHLFAHIRRLNMLRSKLHLAHRSFHTLIASGSHLLFLRGAASRAKEIRADRLGMAKMMDRGLLSLEELEARL